MLNLSAVIAWHVPAMTAERVFEHDPNALPSGYLKLRWCRITLSWSDWYRCSSFEDSYSRYFVWGSYDFVSGLIASNKADRNFARLYTIPKR